MKRFAICCSVFLHLPIHGKYMFARWKRRWEVDPKEAVSRNTGILLEYSYCETMARFDSLPGEHLSSVADHQFNW